MKILSALVVVFGLVCISQIQAEQNETNQGWYINGFGGANFFNNDIFKVSSIDKENKVVNDHWKLHAKPGFLVGGGIGYKFESNTSLSCRLEAGKNQ